MIEPNEVAELIEVALPGAEVTVTDLTGTKDHYSVVVVSEQFEGKLPIKQHRMVNAAVREQIDSGEIHALQLKTMTPDEAAQS